MITQDKFWSGILYRMIISVCVIMPVTNQSWPILNKDNHYDNESSVKKGKLLVFQDFITLWMHGRKYKNVTSPKSMILFIQWNIIHFIKYLHSAESLVNPCTIALFTHFMAYILLIACFGYKSLSLCFQISSQLHHCWQVTRTNYHCIFQLKV